MSRFPQGDHGIPEGTQSPFRLYAGFTAFFAGLALGIAGMAILLSGDLLLQEPDQRYKIGIAVVAIGFPLLFLGLESTLPSRTVVHAVAAAGAVACLAATGLFILSWPDQWGADVEVDRSAQAVVLYTAGLVLLMITVAMALVVNFLSRALLLAGHGEVDDVFLARDRPVTMEEVMRDIEREVARQNLSWGGIEEDRLPREFLKLKADFGEGWTISNGRAGTVTRTKASELDVAFKALERLRGIEGKQEVSAEDTATAIEALMALRRARQAKADAHWWRRLKRWTAAWSRPKRAVPARESGPVDGPKPGPSQAPPVPVRVHRKRPTARSRARQGPKSPALRPIAVKPSD